MQRWQIGWASKWHENGQKLNEKSKTAIVMGYGYFGMHENSKKYRRKIQESKRPSSGGWMITGRRSDGNKQSILISHNKKFVA